MKKNEVKIGGTYLAKVSDKIVPVRIDAEHPSGSGWDATNMATNKKIRIKSAQRLRGPAKRDDANGKSKEIIPVPRGKGRVSAATRADRNALAMAVADLPISNGHIAFGRNGHIYELYFREHNDSPAVWKVDASVALDDLGFRSDGATILYTGVDAVRNAVKAATGKTPSAIGIGLSKWQNTDGAGKTDKPGKPRKLSLIDAAAQVLAASESPMNCKQLVEAVAAKGLWKSEAATPHATLYSAILREIQKKGADARFAKVERGMFTLTKGA